MALQGKYYYEMYMDTANSTNNGSSMWSSSFVSGNYKSSEFVDRLIFDRLEIKEPEPDVSYYLRKHIDRDILNAVKNANILLDRPPQKEYLFDPVNLWSVPNDV